jgi:putative protease
MQLVCPAGSLPALKAAVEAGADAVYLGFRDATNARHFPGLNFTDAQIDEGLALARARGVEVYVALNTYPQPHNWPQWQAAVDRAAALRVDAIIAADLGVLAYATDRHPALARHLSVQGSATSYEALRFYHEQFGIRRAVLPRVLSMAQVRQVVEHSPVQIEVFGFGSLCVMVEGRCLLSSFATGKSPNTCGACSPAEFVRWEETAAGRSTRLGGVLLDRRAPEETAGYPTICKGRYRVGGHTYYAIEEPTSLNTLEVLPELMALGIAAVKIEGRQRSPAYVRDVTRVWRAAIDACRADPGHFLPRAEWSGVLAKMSEGAQTTFGALHRPWQ